MDRSSVQKHLQRAVGWSTVLRIAEETGRQDRADAARAYLDSLQPALAVLNPIEHRVISARFLTGIYGQCIPWRIVAMQIYGRDGAGAIKAAQRAYWSALDRMAAFWSDPNTPAPP